MSPSWCGTLPAVLSTVGPSVNVTADGGLDKVPDLDLADTGLDVADGGLDVADDCRDIRDGRLDIADGVATLDDGGVDDSGE